MIETIMGWIGYTTTSKYLLALAQIQSLKDQIFWLKLFNVSFQIALLLMVSYATYKIYRHFNPKKEKKKEEKKEGE